MDDDNIAGNTPPAVSVCAQSICAQSTSRQSTPPPAPSPKATSLQSTPQNAPAQSPSAVQPNTADRAGAKIKPAKNLAGVEIISKRSDFLLAARAKRQGTKAMMLQGRNRNDEGPARVGFTCSKKVGNAVARNRAKRRLREIARLVLPTYGRAGWDYVLIGRAEATATRDFDALQKDLIYALKKVHG